MTNLELEQLNGIQKEIEKYKRRLKSLSIGKIYTVRLYNEETHNEEYDEFDFTKKEAKLAYQIQQLLVDYYEGELSTNERLFADFEKSKIPAVDATMAKNIPEIERKRVYSEDEMKDSVLGQSGTESRDRFEKLLVAHKVGVHSEGGMGIADLQKIIHRNACEKGFYDNPNRNMGESLMLIVSELGEAVEAHRAGRFADWERYNTVYAGDVEMKEPDWTKVRFESDIKDTFEDELADAAIRIMDLAESMEIDLEAHILAKINYNIGRERLHGKLY
jgi:NTP pyrophosphatase (non-canonical NTP hydrolase)